MFYLRDKFNIPYVEQQEVYLKKAKPHFWGILS